MRRPWRLLAVFLVSALAGGAAMGVYRHLNRPGLDEYRAHAWPVAADARAIPADAGRELRATWFGVTAVLLSDGAHALFVDPFFTRPPGWWGLLTNRQIAPDEGRIAAALRAAGVRELDAVLVSHSHYDHAMDAAVVARQTGAVLAGSPSTANLGRGGGLDERRLRSTRGGEALEFGSFRVRFIPSRHAGATGGRPTGDIESPLAPPARYLDYRQGGTYSILVEHALGSVLLHGSAGFVPGALQGERADVVFLGVALVDALPDYLAQVVETVGATRVVPTHWDDFTRGLDRPLRPGIVGVNLPGFFQAVDARAPGLRALTLEAGTPVTLFARGDGHH